LNEHHLCPASDHVWSTTCVRFRGATWWWYSRPSNVTAPSAQGRGSKNADLNPCALQTHRIQARL